MKLGEKFEDGIEVDIYALLDDAGENTGFALVVVDGVPHGTIGLEHAMTEQSLAELLREAVDDVVGMMSEAACEKLLPPVTTPSPSPGSSDC